MTLRDRVLKRVADLFRPWHDNGLPEELQFSDLEYPASVRGYMGRMASMSVKLNIAFGVIDVIGIDYARTVIGAWRPRHLLLMEDVSFAFWPIEDRCARELPVPEIHVRRSTAMICKYLEHVGEPVEPDRIRQRIETYIVDMKTARQKEHEAEEAMRLAKEQQSEPHE